jgi:hypothetical protein
MKVELVGGMSEKERLAWAKRELEAIETDGKSLWCDRLRLEEVRRCVWEGQHPDGRKHKDEDTGEEAFPFEGAADNRLRLVDQIINEKAMLCVTAALRAPVVVRGMRSGNNGFGKRMETALKWIMRNQWGSEMMEWLMLLAQYREGDQPAAALAGVYWDRREALRLKRITIQELQALYLQMLQARIEPEVWPEVEREAQAYAEALPEELVAAVEKGEGGSALRLKATGVLQGMDRCLYKEHPGRAALQLAAWAVSATLRVKEADEVLVEKAARYAHSKGIDVAGPLVEYILRRKY